MILYAFLCVSIRAEEHGQVSRELAEPYYLYGRALLELAREKSAMFGKAIPGEQQRGWGRPLQE